jgi:hypothetical protein
VLSALIKPSNERLILAPSASPRALDRPSCSIRRAERACEPFIAISGLLSFPPDLALFIGDRLFSDDFPSALLRN